MSLGPHSRFVALLLVAGCAAWADDAQSGELLARFKQKVGQDIGQLSNCTCRETIERTVREPGAKAFQLLDRIRLEVARAGQKELMTWPDGERFEDRDLRAFFGGGLMVTGMFASQAHVVFAGDMRTFQYAGPEDIHGRHSVRVDFHIPPQEASYRLGANGKAAWVAASGSFWFDAASLTLVQLDVSADEIPPELGVSGAVTRLEYEKIATATGEMLAPASADISMTHASGEVRRDSIRFSGCREYTANSSIRFEAPDPQEAVQQKLRDRVEVPAGLVIRMETTDEFDWKTAAVGDPVHARVTKAVRWQGGMVPKGAIVSGRLQGMTRARGGGFVLTLALSEMRWGQNQADFNARLFELADPQRPPLRSKAGDANNMLSLSDDSLPGEAPGVAAASRQIAAVPDRCTLVLKEEKWHLSAGMGMAWRTLGE